MLKNGDSGEILAIQKYLPCIDIIEEYPLNRFLFALSEKEKAEEIEKQKKKFILFYDKVVRGDYDMVLLDEACAAYAYGSVPLDMLMELVHSKPEKTELILTGRDPAPELTALAHYISEIKKIRHPYDQGMGAREGVEK
ncbi:hypothetical protein SDC9_197245 [bioreactor metagenome]|uniref:Cob(I)yrinic acid a,c-diamide adenosyltransferase n=1 Tax=bioreactor metagenome TaxID=1076179 RepID=A0A645IQS7_9ZZZZ